MGLIGIIAGLILLLAGSTWFAGAATVGWILLIAGAVLVLLQLLVFGKAAREVKRGFDRFDRL